MPDQLGYPCADHDPSRCSCDERRDREAGRHRASRWSNIGGGYQCVCGAPVPCRDDPPLPPGTCPLCEVEDPLYRVGPWSVVPSPDRAEGAHHHLLLVPDTHVADLLDLDREALAAFWPALEWVRDTYGVGAYGLAVNTGGHVHAQVITGDADRTVRIAIGNKEDSRV